MNCHRLLTALALLGLVCSCHHDHEGHNHGHEGHSHAQADEHNDDDAHEGHRHNADDILLTHDKAEAAGVATETARRGTFHHVIETSGSIQAASCDETTIVATVSGVVSHAQHISEGMALTRGTTVYYISSGQLQEGDQARRIEIDYLTAEREYERARPLADDQIISQKDFAAIQRDYETARLAYEAVGQNATGRGVAVKAPSSGFMKECRVKDGDYVSVGDPLMVITRNQHLYLRAEVPVRYYALLNQISTAKFRTQYSDEVFDLADMHGELLSSGKSVVSTSSYVPVTFQLDNHGTIVPGSYAEVFLVTGQRDNVLSVPTSALTEEQGVYYIYIQTEPDVYRKREVQLGESDGSRTEILSGLEEGELVVVHGAINVKLAGTAKAIPGHTHNH